MSREEFEAWIEDQRYARIQEAFDRLPKGDRSIEKWLKAFALSLAEVAKEESEEAEIEDDETSLSDDLDDDLEETDDEEEEAEDD